MLYSLRTVDPQVHLILRSSVSLLILRKYDFGFGSLSVVIIRCKWGWYLKSKIDVRIDDCSGNFLLGEGY